MPIKDKFSTLLQSLHLWICTNPLLQPSFYRKVIIFLEKIISILIEFSYEINNPTVE